MAPITVDSVELGSHFIEARDVKLKTFSKTNEMVGEIELEYTGIEGEGMIHFHEFIFY